MPLDSSTVISAWCIKSISFRKYLLNKIHLYVWSVRVDFVLAKLTYGQGRLPPLCIDFHWAKLGPVKQGGNPNETYLIISLWNVLSLSAAFSGYCLAKGSMKQICDTISTDGILYTLIRGKRFLPD